MSKSLKRDRWDFDDASYEYDAPDIIAEKHRRKKERQDRKKRNFDDYAAANSTTDDYQKPAYGR